MGKRSRPNCDKNGYKCKQQRKAVTLEEKLSVNSLYAFSCYAMISWKRINGVIRGFAVYENIDDGNGVTINDKSMSLS
jgi:hypothetical protein